MPECSSQAARRLSSISCRTPNSARSCGTSMRSKNRRLSLCHGPIASLAAMPNARQFRAALIARDMVKALELARGWQYAGYRMTVFSASEEKSVEENILHGKLYFTMPDALQIAGGDVSTNTVDFEPYVVEDRELITGQNPRSDHPLAAKFIAALDRATAAG